MGPMFSVSFLLSLFDAFRSSSCEFSGSNLVESRCGRRRVVFRFWRIKDVEDGIDGRTLAQDLDRL